MQINLRAHAINRRQAAKIALLDAIIWQWFHQINYESSFTANFLMGPGLGLPILILSVALVIGVGMARWDGVPRAMRAFVAVGTSAALLALVTLPFNDPALADWYAPVTLTLAVLAPFVAMLRLETLAKCDDFATLSVALAGSLMLFYGLNLAILLVPSEVYNACIVAAPLALLIGVDRPAPAISRMGPLPKKVILGLPTALPCLVGAAVGFVVSLGTVSMATSPVDLFTHPSPLFLIAQLLFLMLGIVTAFGLDLRKAVYFSIINLCWGAGTLTGTVVRGLLPELPEALLASASSFICLMTFVVFFAFSGSWINSLGRATIRGKEELVQQVAREGGLTKRETEVVELLLEGRSLRIIQEELFISEGTARTHTKRIYAKLGVHSKQELIDYFKQRLPQE